MHKRVRLSLIALFFAVAPILSAAPATAQVAFIRPEAVQAEGALQDVFQRGQLLESERRWGEALTLYEEALREHPDNSGLDQRHDLSKLYYELGRRYADASFRRGLRTMSDQAALDVYSEVLLKIHSHYVEQPNWKQLVDRGTAAVHAAVIDPDFVDYNLRDVPRDQIEQFREELRAGHLLPAVNTRNDAREAVRRVSEASAQRLGLRPTAVVMEYLCGAASSLDSYSTYLTSDQLEEVYSQIEGNFVGLGVELKAQDGALLIVNVIPGSPAEREGIRIGDRIVAVDGHSTSEVSTDQAADMLQGEENSLVSVRVVSPGAPPRQVRIKREHVEVPSVDDAKMVDAAAGIAYFKLTSFQKTTTRDVDAALWKLHREGMKSLIIDLRGNPGGLLTAAVDVADRFVQQGTIVSTHGRNSQEDLTYSANRYGTWRVPLVVLIDRDSASASEIFAGAVRDHRRGAIVGDRSYGKGSVQGIFPLTAGAGVRLTTAKFFSPLGRPFNGVGVEPDVVVRTAAKPVIINDEAPPRNEPADDAVLDAAVNVARNQLAQR